MCVNIGPREWKVGGWVDGRKRDRGRRRGGAGAKGSAAREEEAVTAITV